jgi:hypothetical protein
MKNKPYCCEAIVDTCTRNTISSSKGVEAIFQYTSAPIVNGVMVLGNVLGSLFRRILPILKTYGPHALRTSANIVDDVSKGKSWKDATLQRVPETISNFVFNKNSQSGSGLRRRRTCKSKKTVKRIKRDIFS